MTREKEIENKAIEKSAEYRFGQLYLYNNDVYSGFIQGAQWADKNPKSSWISVEDDLPCNHEELLKTPKSYRTKSVFVRFDNNMHGLMYMTKIPNKWEWFNKIKGITHWMPIPELPKE